MESLFALPKFRKLLDTYSSVNVEQLPTSVDLYKNPFRQNEREHLEGIFARISDASYKRDVQRRLLSPDLSSYFGAWYELMVYNWLELMGKHPVPQPSIPNAKSKPDFLIRSDGLQIFIEVTVVHEAQKDQDVRKQTSWLPAATATFETMRGRLIDKMGQHSIPQDSAYIICLCLESRLINLSEVKTCFFGGESVVLKTGDLRANFDGEIFENQPGYPLLVKHRDVSALLVAKRNEQSIENGYKPIFGLIQNPYALNPIAQDEFEDIQRYVIISETESHFEMKWI